MATGTVKRFNDAKGFGFIIRMMAAKICSLTSPQINMAGFKSLKEGEKVTFDVTKARRASKPRISRSPDFSGF